MTGRKLMYGVRRIVDEDSVRALTTSKSPEGTALTTPVQRQSLIDQVKARAVERRREKAARTSTTRNVHGWSSPGAPVTADTTTTTPSITANTTKTLSVEEVCKFTCCFRKQCCSKMIPSGVDKLRKKFEGSCDNFFPFLIFFCFSLFLPLQADLLFFFPFCFELYS